jgi:hypothetical protein
MARFIRLYVIACAALAAACVIALFRLNSSVDSPQIVAGLSYVALGLLSQVFQVRKAGLVSRSGVSTAFLPLLAAVLLAPTWLTVFAVAVSCTISELWDRRAPIKALFNIAQATLSLGVAVLVYVMLGGGSLLDNNSHFLPYVVAVACFLLVNRTAVSIVVALASSKNFPRIWVEAILSTVVYDVLSLPFAWVFASVYAGMGFLGAIILAIPLLGLRELYKKNEELNKANQELLELMVAAIEARDPYTSGHSRRVSENARLIAQTIGLKEKEVERTAIAALLHDVGKIHESFAPILQKPGKLTPEEHAIMQTHPVKSAELVGMVSQLSDLIAPVRHHHENWDGTGYPDRKKAEEIPLISRIIMFADTIDAMTTDRPYRRALDEAAVRRELLKWRGRQFDPTICDAVLSSDIISKMAVPHPVDVPAALPVNADATPQRSAIA